MSVTHNYWAIVPAAGAGLRFGTELPKQYAQLAGKPVISHCLGTLASAGYFTRIIVALDASDGHFGGLVPPANVPLQVVAGGATRATSVFNAMQALQGTASTNDWVVVHDAARPLLTETALTALIEALSDDPVGGILAQRVHDTVKLVATCNAQVSTVPDSVSASTSTSQAGVTRVERTLDRESVWLAQTPQMFRYGLLYDALDAALRHPSTGAQVTDEASAVELAGLPVRLVLGEAPNIKITTGADLELAEFYLSATTKSAGEHK